MKSRINKLTSPARRAVIALFANLLLLIAAASLGLAAETRLRVGWLQVLNTLPYFVIREHGLDKKNGLAIEEVLYRSGEQIIEALAHGSIDITVNAGSVPIFVAAQKGLIPDKVLPVAGTAFADPRHPNSGALVPPSIKSWKDLKGQLIAVNAKNSLNAVAFNIRLKQEGVQDYKLVEMAFPNMGLAVAGGNVAAAGLSEPYVTQSLLRGDGRLLEWVIGGAPFERFQIAMIAARPDAYRRNAPAVKAFLRAYLQAVKWIQENEADARLILGKRLQLSREVIRKLNLFRSALDARNDPALLDDTQRILVEAGLLKAPIPAKRLYDEKLLDEVLRERR